MKSPVATLCALLATSFSLTIPGYAADAEYQSFFSQACTNPGGRLAQRCAETNGGTGNISTDSESSLVPSHMLSASDTSLATEAYAGARPTTGTLIKSGPLSATLSLSQGEIESERADAIDAERSYLADSRGASINIDYRHSETKVSGLILFFEKSDMEFEPEAAGRNFTPAARAADYESNTAGISGFFSHSGSHGAFIDIAASYARSDFRFERHSVFQESNRVIAQTNVDTSANADGDARLLLIRGGKAVNIGRLTLAPHAAFQFTKSVIDSYSERDNSNSGLAMRYAKSSQISRLGLAALSLQLPLNTDFGVLTPQWDLQYHREFGRDDNQLEAVLINDLNGNVFTTKGDAPDRSYFRHRLSLVAILRDGWMPYIDYTYLSGNSEYSENRVNLGVRMAL